MLETDSALSGSGESIEEILADFPQRRGVLLAILHRVQDAYGYIPLETLDAIARHLNMTRSLVYGAITFYSEFRTTPPARNVIDMCLGPTCHLRDAQAIKRRIEERLSIGPKGNAADGSVTLHVVQCAGFCHMAPLVYLNGEAHGQVTREGVDALLEDLVPQEDR